MMTLSGSLHIQKFGAPAFLHCNLGYFAVQDERLAETPAGKHPGFFEIKKIHPHAFVAKDGTVAVHVAAVLKNFSLQTVSPGLLRPKRQESSQQQQLSLLLKEEVLTKEEANETGVAVKEIMAAPTEVVASEDVAVDTEKQAVLSTNAIEVTTPTVEETATEPNVVAVEAPVICTEPGVPVTCSPDDILGTAVESLATEIMLDASLSRDQLSQCIIRLNSLNYQIDKKRQVWLKPVTS